jgi:hypothetical protein
MFSVERLPLIFNFQSSIFNLKYGRSYGRSMGGLTGGVRGGLENHNSLIIKCLVKIRGGLG